MTEEQKKVIQEMTVGGHTAREIAVHIGANYEAVRSYIKRWRKANNLSRDMTGKLVKDFDNGNVFQSYNATANTYTYEFRIKLPKGELITPDKVMALNNIDSSKWDVVSFTVNNWQNFTAQDKSVDMVDLFQVKMTLKPKADNGLMLEDIKKYFEECKWKSIDAPSPVQYDNEGDILEVDITDLHSGLLSHYREVYPSGSFDVQIACDRLVEVFQRLVGKCKGRKFQKIIVASLGDILHIDSNQNGGQTTRGTVQDSDGRVERMVEKTFDAFITCINMLLELAPVEFIYVKGNHDEVVGSLFAFALKQAYRDNENISFDISPNPQKARLIGQCLVGWEHNSNAKSRQGDWLVNDYRNLFARSRYAELHAGHLHSQSTNEKATGVVVRNLPALCGASAWEHQNGYRSYRAMICFVWNESELLSEQWYFFI